MAEDCRERGKEEGLLTRWSTRDFQLGNGGSERRGVRSRAGRGRPGGDRGRDHRKIIISSPRGGEGGFGRGSTSLTMAVAAAGKKGRSCSMEIRRRGCAPPLPRPPGAAAVVRSVTRDEIDRFWRRKRMEEEDHLLAALKAAARIRARNLKEEDYRQFEASLEGILRYGGADAAGKIAGIGEEAGVAGNKEELRAVIRDWWTKSKYAYLNQPALPSMEPEAAATKRASTFVPNACFYPVVVVSTTKPSCSAPLGVF